jgi:diguanylate cyclase
MDPLTISLAAGVAAVAGAGVGLRWWYRTRQAEAETRAAAERLHRQLQEARHAASHDPLTDLPNRQTFNRLGAELLADPTKPPLVGVVVDLDNLRHVNDTAGRPVGDEVLVTMSRRLAAYASGNLVGRIGGDEFAALLSSADPDWSWPYPAGAWLAEALARPMRVASGTVVVSATVGFAPVHGFADLPEVLRRAERALARAKSTGRHSACFDPLLDNDAPAPGGPPALPRPRQRETNEQPRTPPADGALAAAAVRIAPVRGLPAS